MSEPANKNASHKRPGPKRRDSVDVGLNVKLNRTITISTKTAVVPSNSPRAKFGPQFLGENHAGGAREGHRFALFPAIAHRGHDQNFVRIAARARIVRDSSAVEPNGARDRFLRFIASMRAHQNRATRIAQPPDRQLPASAGPRDRGPCRPHRRAASRARRARRARSRGAAACRAKMCAPGPWRGRRGRPVEGPAAHVSAGSARPNSFAKKIRFSSAVISS